MDGKELVCWRRKWQLTRYQLAKLLDRGESTIRAYEAGRRRIPLVVVMALREVERRLQRR